VRRLELSPLALDDLDAIRKRLEEERPGRAAKFMAELRARGSLLQEFPLAGPVLSIESGDLRRLVLWEYLMIYRVETETVRVERVVHGSRDLTTLLDDQDDA
jgi:toxin ParE1/3/4